MKAFLVALAALVSVSGASAAESLGTYISGKPILHHTGMLVYETAGQPLEGCVVVLATLDGKKVHILYSEDQCHLIDRFGALAHQDVIVGLNNSSKRATAIRDRRLISQLRVVIPSGLFKNKKVSFWEILD